MHRGWAWNQRPGTGDPLLLRFQGQGQFTLLPAGSTVPPIPPTLGWREAPLRDACQNWHFIPQMSFNLHKLSEACDLPKVSELRREARIRMLVYLLSLWTVRKHNKRYCKYHGCREFAANIERHSFIHSFIHRYLLYSVSQALFQASILWWLVSTAREMDNKQVNKLLLDGANCYEDSRTWIFSDGRWRVANLSWGRGRHLWGSDFWVETMGSGPWRAIGKSRHRDQQERKPRDGLSWPVGVQEEAEWLELSKKVLKDESRDGAGPVMRLCREGWGD